MQTNLLEARRVIGSRPLTRALRARDQTGARPARIPRSQAARAAAAAQPLQRHCLQSRAQHQGEPRRAARSHQHPVDRAAPAASAAAGATGAPASSPRRKQAHRRPRAPAPGSAHPPPLSGSPARGPAGVRSADTAGGANGLADTGTRRASEQLMQRYYRNARAVMQLNEIILQNLRSSVFPQAEETARTLNDRFQVRSELLGARAEDLFSASRPQSSRCSS